MPVQMAPHQLAFWRELLAPFAPEELSEVPARGGKKTLTYIDKRALSNRLDSVCGPDGWYPEYEATNRGYKCRLHISVPCRTPGTFVMMHKEDGAGFEEMGSFNKQTNEWEADVDNDEKSGYTNAFRRAAQDAWGIGRYLYRKGIPGFLDPNARPSAPPPEPAPAQSNYETPTTRPIDGSDRPAPPPQAPPAQAQGQGKSFDNFRIPPTGKPVFAWCKEMEKVFETRLVDGMQREGKNLCGSTTFAEWSQEVVNQVATGVIAYIKSLPTYKGQFDHIATGPGPEAPPPAQPTAAPAATPGVNLADLRKEVITKLTALVQRQIGRAPEAAEMVPAIRKLAHEVPNDGGEVHIRLESLRDCNDATWLRNMIAEADRQIAESVKAGDQGQDDIPF